MDAEKAALERQERAEAAAYRDKILAEVEKSTRSAYAPESKIALLLSLYKSAFGGLPALVNGELDIRPEDLRKNREEKGDFLNKYGRKLIHHLRKCAANHRVASGLPACSPRDFNTQDAIDALISLGMTERDARAAAVRDAFAMTAKRVQAEAQPDH